MAKFAKLPYNVSRNVAGCAFELVHMDAWGPYRICTCGKYMYFITIVDDFSRATWAYLVQYKSDAYAVIDMYINFVKTQFGVDVMKIRPDNELEFDDVKFRQLFAHKGIVHQTSCVDRPQQNGRVERKHRNVLEMARALRM